MNFEIISPITNIEMIAVENGIRDIRRLRRMYGKGRWRKLKGEAIIKLWNGKTRIAELHRYQAHGIGKREMKRKRYLY